MFAYHFLACFQRKFNEVTIVVMWKWLYFGTIVDLNVIQCFRFIPHASTPLPSLLCFLLREWITQSKHRTNWDCHIVRMICQTWRSSIWNRKTYKNTLICFRYQNRLYTMNIWKSISYFLIIVFEWSAWLKCDRTRNCDIFQWRKCTLINYWT